MCTAWRAWTCWSASGRVRAASCSTPRLLWQTQGITARLHILHTAGLTCLTSCLPARPAAAPQTRVPPSSSCSWPTCTPRPTPPPSTSCATSCCRRATQRCSWAQLPPQALLSPGVSHAAAVPVADVGAAAAAAALLARCWMPAGAVGGAAAHHAPPGARLTAPLPPAPPPPP